MHRTILEDAMPTYEFKPQFLREMQIRTLMAAERQAAALEKIVDSLAEMTVTPTQTTIINKAPEPIPCHDEPHFHPWQIGTEHIGTSTAPWTINEGPVGKFPPYSVNPFSTTPIPVTGPAPITYVTNSNGSIGATGNPGNLTDANASGLASLTSGPAKDRLDALIKEAADACGDPGCRLCYDDPGCRLCYDDPDEIWPADDSGLTTEGYVESWLKALARVKRDGGYIPWDDIRPKGDPIGIAMDTEARWTFTTEDDSKSTDGGRVLKMHDAATDKDRIIFRGTRSECSDLWSQVRA